MGILVKLVGGGLGLASEAIHDYRARSRSQSGRTPSPNPATAGTASAAIRPAYATPAAAASSSSSAAAAAPQSARYLGAVPYAEAPPEYVEVADEAAADRLVRSGRAERVVDYADEKKQAGGYPGSRGQGRGEYSQHDDYPSYDGEFAYEDDEAAWELDDMAERVAPPSYVESPAATTTVEDSDEAKARKKEQMIRDLVRMAGAPPHPVRRIPCPVIIPQRRPGNKDRGFVHAYAPVLADCGVSQDVFLKFLQDWLAASKADPWINVVFLAASIVSCVPETASMIVGTVVSVVAGTASEMQSRHRRNTFLDRVNQELFMPRGLYAMVMAFKDEVPAQQPSGPLSKLARPLGGKTLYTTQRLDINQTVAKYSHPDPNMSKLKRGLQDTRLVSGKTYTALELPEAAALIYPDLDRLVENDQRGQGGVVGKGKGKDADSGGVKDKLKGAGAWVQDYLDRKAQASYEREHQGSALAVPSDSRRSFSSRFNDPNHPVNSGSLISLVTGGAIDTSGRRNERRAAKQERKDMRRESRDARRMARGKAPQDSRRQQQPQGQRKGTVHKLMQQDVLYLLIVNLPSEQELQQSVATLESMTTGTWTS